MNRVLLVNALQLNAIAAAGMALGWMATRAWWTQTDPPLRSEYVLLTCQKFIGISFVAFFIVPVALRLIALPDRAGAGTFAAGRFEAWLALLLVVAVAIAFDKLFSQTLSVTLLAFSTCCRFADGLWGGAIRSGRLGRSARAAGRPHFHSWLLILPETCQSFAS